MPKTGLTSEQLRDRAIACTVDRMRKFGFEKVRLSDIAKDLGVTHAALYGHFSDKAALFDAVTERWLLELDEKLAVICKSPGDPLDLIIEWCVELHRAKCEKVRFDPELYRAFNFTAQLEKPFVQNHIATMYLQMEGLLQHAIDRKQIVGDAKAIADLVLNATTGFHHPVLVMDYIDEEREPLLKELLRTIFKGLAKTK